MASSSTSSTSLALGIDLGTTFCCVAVLRHRDAEPEVLQNNVGKNTTPSYVAYGVAQDDSDSDDDEKVDVVAGDTAKDLAHQNPENTIFDIKRLIGRIFEDPNIQKYKKLWPFHLVNIHGFVGVKVQEETLLPQTIATNLIAHLKKTAEAALGVSVDSAVVTVPVYFTDLHKGLTKDACEKAGFKNIQFIVEPVAAAVAYGFESSIQSHETKTCLIYDLGGGTFDVTVFRLGANKRIEIKATGGDDRLGGEDFNDLLTEYCLNEFQKLHGVNLAEGKTSDDAGVRKNTARKLRRLRAQCERQKCYLASTPSVVVSLDGAYGDKQLVVPVTRTLLEKLISPLLNRSMKILDETLKKSGCEKEEIDDVILIGGSSRIPKVQQMVQEYFAGKQIRRTIDADEAVACGAAVHAFNVFKENGAPYSVVTLLEEAQSRPHNVEPASSLQLSAAASLLKTVRWGNKINGFPPRMNHAAVCVGSSIYSFGGEGASGDPSYSRDVLDVFMLNVSDLEKKWKKLPVENSEVNPTQREGHSAVAHKEFVLIFGGYDTQKQKYSNSTHRFNTQSRKWDKQKVTGNVPGARCDHTAVVCRNEMLIHGGSGREVTNDLHSLHLDSFCWSTIGTRGIPASLRSCHSATVHDDRFIFIFGGLLSHVAQKARQAKEMKTVNLVHSFDLHSKTWTAVETRGTPPSSRWNHCAFVHNRRMYIFGGGNYSSYLNGVFLFDPETFEWKQVTPNGEAPSPRHSAACVALEDQVIIFGGYNSEGRYLRDTHVLQL